MPRVGGEFVAPFPPVVPDTTIESAVHNGIVADFVLDANQPRPITAGGTGATSPAAARTNLQTEVSGVPVTNFDSHVFENGSWHCLDTATGGPGAYYMSGICSKLDVNNLMLVAVSYSTGDRWVRRKMSGVWGVWEAWLNDADGRYINVGGDTMTGPLYVPTITDPGAFLQAANKTYVDDAVDVFASAINTLTARIEALERKIK